MKALRKILITGGAGFIGSHLADAYLADGWQVGIIDDLSSGNARNLTGLPLAFYQSSILDKPQLSQVFADFLPTHVSHHAAQVSVRRSLLEPAHDAKVNIEGTINLLEAAISHKVERLVFASSGGAIYGENEASQPTGEATKPQPVSPYALSKLVAEQYIHYFQKHRGLPATILRYANVYGPRQDPAGEAGVISLFLDKFKQGQPALIYGSGEQVRDFIFVGDVVAANLAVVNQSVDGTMNIGTGQVTSVTRLYRTLAELWRQQTGQAAPPPDSRPPVPGEIYWSQLSIAKANQALNWQPKVTLEDGLKQTVQWFTR